MKYLSFFILALVTFSCNQNQNTGPSEGLTLIPKDQIVKRIKAGTLDYRYAKFKTQSGASLSAKEQEMLNDGNLGKDYYEDANGVIKEVMVRPIEMEDKFIDIQRRELSNNPMQGIQSIDIDCNNLDEIFAEVSRSDQDARKNGGDIPAVDTKNLQIVASAISKCGWSQAHIKTVWLVLQHAPIGVSAYYYEDLKAFSEQGNLSLTSLAMLQDRLLMRHGYKQLYGTQIVGGALYKLEDPEGVNERRKKMSMGKIEDFVGIWGLDFEAEKQRMKNE